MSALPDYPSPEVIEPPYGFYETLRHDAPVHRLAGGELMVTRWADVERIVRDTGTFSNVIGPCNAQILGGERVGATTAGRGRCRSPTIRSTPASGTCAGHWWPASGWRGSNRCIEFRSEFAELLPGASSWRHSDSRARTSSG